MSQDPIDPSYLPDGSGTTSHDAGNGNGFGADLYRLYRAGYLKFPEVANTYSTAISQLAEARAGAERFAAARPEPALRKLGTLLEDLHDAMWMTANNMHLTGEALVQVADDYVRTDEAARTEFVTRKKDLQDSDPADFSEPPEAYRPPPRADDPLPWDGPGPYPGWPGPPTR